MDYLREGIPWIPMENQQIRIQKDLVMNAARPTQFSATVIIFCTVLYLTVTGCTPRKDESANETGQQPMPNEESKTEQKKEAAPVAGSKDGRFSLPEFPEYVEEPFVDPQLNRHIAAFLASEKRIEEIASQRPSSTKLPIWLDQFINSKSKTDYDSLQSLAMRFPEEHRSLFDDSLFDGLGYMEKFNEASESFRESLLKRVAELPNVEVQTKKEIEEKLCEALRYLNSNEFKQRVNNAVEDRRKRLRNQLDKLRIHESELKKLEQVLIPKEKQNEDVAKSKAFIINEESYRLVTDEKWDTYFVLADGNNKAIRVPKGVRQGIGWNIIPLPKGPNNFMVTGRYKHVGATTGENALGITLDVEMYAPAVDAPQEPSSELEKELSQALKRVSKSIPIFEEQLRSVEKLTKAKEHRFQYGAFINDKQMVTELSVPVMKPVFEHLAYLSLDSVVVLRISSVTLADLIRGIELQLFDEMSDYHPFVEDSEIGKKQSKRLRQLEHKEGLKWEEKQREFYEDANQRAKTKAAILSLVNAELPKQFLERHSLSEETYRVSPNDELLIRQLDSDKWAIEGYVVAKIGANTRLTIHGIESVSLGEYRIPWMAEVQGSGDQWQLAGLGLAFPQDWQRTTDSKETASATMEGENALESKQSIESSTVKLEPIPKGTLNLVLNPNFALDGKEVKSPKHWKTSPASADEFAWVGWRQENAKFFLTHLHWKKNYSVRTSQQITLPNGIYRLRFTALCSGGQATACAQVHGHGGKELKTANLGKLTEPKEFRLENIQVSTGKIEISFVSNAKAGQWLNVTDVVLEKVADTK